MCPIIRFSLHANTTHPQAPDSAQNGKHNVGIEIRRQEAQVVILCSGHDRKGRHVVKSEPALSDSSRQRGRGTAREDALALGRAGAVDGPGPSLIAGVAIFGQGSILLLCIVLELEYAMGGVNGG